MAVTKEILSLAVETGDALLRNGAEVYRVEDTVMHILEAYEIEEYDVYVLSNGRKSFSAVLEAAVFHFCLAELR